MTNEVFKMVHLKSYSLPGIIGLYSVRPSLEEKIKYIIQGLERKINRDVVCELDTNISVVFGVVPNITPCEGSVLRVVEMTVPVMDSSPVVSF